LPDGAGGSQGGCKKGGRILRKKGVEKADKKAEREVKAGMVFAYLHHTGRLGSLVGWPARRICG